MLGTVGSISALRSSTYEHRLRANKINKVHHPVSTFVSALPARRRYIDERFYSS